MQGHLPADHVTIKLTADDKDLALVVEDKVIHGEKNMIITAVGGDGTYGIGNDDDRDGGGVAFAAGITREDLTLVEGERMTEINTLSMGDIFFKKLMDPDYSRKSPAQSSVVCLAPSPRSRSTRARGHTPRKRSAAGGEATSPITGRQGDHEG
ncbi:hypothetical protein OAO87_00265 [bacterium]|nr:hypothetical protein [bacterium]